VIAAQAQQNPAHVEAMLLLLAERHKAERRCGARAPDNPSTPSAASATSANSDSSDIPRQAATWFLVLRTSQDDMAGNLLTASELRQLATLLAVVHAMLADLSLVRVRVIREVQSVHAVRPEQRPAIRQLLREVQAGDVVLAATPDRLGRSGDDAAWIVQQLAGKGVAIGVACVGWCAPVAALLLHDGGQQMQAKCSSSSSSGGGGGGGDSSSGSGSDGDSSSGSSVQAAQLRAAVYQALDGPAWARVAEHGGYGSRHDFMKHMLATDRCHGPVIDLLRVLTSDAHVIRYARVSPHKDHGETDLPTGLSAQLEFLAGLDG
jgi:uncharacterized membrane protein YgcG